MDDELAALGVTVADERAQEASVLGRRLASGAGLAPPLQIPSAAEGEWVGVGEVELFPKVALERLLELARGAAHAGNALRASAIRDDGDDEDLRARLADLRERGDLGESEDDDDADGPRRRSAACGSGDDAAAPLPAPAARRVLALGAPRRGLRRHRRRRDGAGEDGPGRRVSGRALRGRAGPGPLRRLPERADPGADDDAEPLGARAPRLGARARVVVLHRSSARFDEAVKAGPAALATFLARALAAPPRPGEAGGAPGPDFEETPSCVLCVASYDAVHRLADALLAVPWSYAVLDEGQKLRNPDSRVTQLCKRLRTPRRLLLSGTPVQNSLRELWSLFDFADQIDLYRHVLDGDDVRKALAGDGGQQATAFARSPRARKICNHPDLYGGPPEGEPPGAASRSSKLAALDAVLVRWKAQGHRVLVFSQTIAMLGALEALTDAQARERSWRLGQTKPVTIYRLVCAGTIEEKIYHRQIFKQALTNKVLSDAGEAAAALLAVGARRALHARRRALAGATDSGDVARVEDFAQRRGAGRRAGRRRRRARRRRARDDDDKQVLEALWDGSPDGALAKVFAAGDDEARQSAAARPRRRRRSARRAGRRRAVLDSRDEARGDAADLFGGTAPGSAALLGAIARRNDRARARARTRAATAARSRPEAARGPRPAPRRLAECRGGGWRKK
ncbi:ATP-dependent helicase [Aureococcus anophagefferens]|uniref:ATP-dependent helicase n=1 Tax=Aureococcus anophagefferens TaxID=44056 RepID=A0ABR1G8E3_AURAN